MTAGEAKILPWLRLSRVPEVGPILGSRLLAAFGSVEKIFAASEEELVRVEGINRATAQGLRAPSAEEAAEKDWRFCQEHGIRVVTSEDPGYPRPLREIHAPPLLLFVRGQWEEKDEESVAVVGCRRPDTYGESMAMSLGAGLARVGFTVVSGMARGIDGIAQRAALKAGGRSVAVLGTGVDVVYPSENADLYNMLLEKGAVVSEFPPGTPPAPTSFPRRNRIISGLTRGVIMVQAMSEQSGALITVRHALEQGREVFAVPGNVGSRGGRIGNKLIKEGARLVESVEDVLLYLRGMESLPLFSPSESDIKKQPRQRRPPALPDLQARIYSLVPTPAEGEISADELICRSGGETAEVQAALLELELAGIIRLLPGRKYVRLTEE